MTLLYVPCKDEKEARMIAKTLLKEKLIACANLIPSQSLFRWENEVKEENETICIMKTKENHSKDAKKRIEELHSYECPCILTLDAKANDIFDTWVKGELK